MRDSVSKTRLDHPKKGYQGLASGLRTHTNTMCISRYNGESLKRKRKLKDCGCGLGQPMSDTEFHAILGHSVRPCLQRKITKQKTKQKQFSFFF